MASPRVSSSSAVSRVDNLPSATVQCHASNLLQLPDGTILCAWFGGTQEGVPDISIYLSRLPPRDASAQWSTPVRVSSDATRSEQNPVLFRAPETGTLWLFHTSQPAGNQDKAVILARTSADDGHTWSEPRPAHAVSAQEGAFVRQPVVVLADGTWVLPIWYCRTPEGYRWTGSDDVAAVLWTRDQGRTWTETAVPDSVGCVHMNIVHLATDGYAAFFRSRWADHVYRSTSSDGIHWAPPVPTTLPNPNAGIGAAVLPPGSGGHVVLVFNDAQATPDMPRRLGLYDDITPHDDDPRPNQPGQAAYGGRTAVWGTPRKALSVGLSRDGGATWQYRVLEDGDGWCMSNNSKDKMNRELSYPSIVVDGATSNKIHVAYTYFRQTIKYVCIDDVEAFVRA